METHTISTHLLPAVEPVHDVSYVWHAQTCVFGRLDCADRQLHQQKIGREVGFFRKDGSMVDTDVTMFRQQSNAKCTKRKKQMDEEEEKEGDAVSEVSRQLPTHQNQPVTKMAQGYDRQHSVSTPMPSQNRLPVVLCIE